MRIREFEDDLENASEARRMEQGAWHQALPPFRPNNDLRTTLPTNQRLT